jgi:hypothetical protein
MTEKQKVQSHWTWIVSLLVFVLFNVAFQYFMYCLWTGDGNHLLWVLCIVVMCVAPCVGVYVGGLFLLRNKHFIPPLKSMFITIGGVALVVGNLVCFGFTVFFLVAMLCAALPRLWNYFISVIAG